MEATFVVKSTIHRKGPKWPQKGDMTFRRHWGDKLALVKFNCRTKGVQ